jgi:trehalose 6-phosphate phosphatase
MQYLFTPSGLARLCHAVERESLCMFDFDGTLAPIVARPDDAQLSGPVRERMIALCRVGTVGILTGRALDDIRPRLGFTPQYTVGNHGIEGLPGAAMHAAEFGDLCRRWHAALEKMLAEGPADPGILIENKGVSLSVHYRLTHEPERSARRLHESFSRLQPVPRVMPGKYVFNLLPQGAADKGSAMIALLAQTGAPGAVYVGDDVTDEDVFRRQRSDILGIRTDYDASSAAEFFLLGQHEMPRLLDELIRCLAGAAQRARSAS